MLFLVICCFLGLSNPVTDSNALQETLITQTQEPLEIQLKKNVQEYIDIFSSGDILEGENRPDVFQLLGNPDALVFIKFAKLWKEKFNGVPILCVGGYGVGTRELILRTLVYYQTHRNITPAEEAWLKGALSEIDKAHNGRGVVNHGERNKLIGDLGKIGLKCGEYDIPGATESCVLKYILQKEGVLSGYINLEANGSSDTRQNFENNIGLIKRLSNDKVNPVIGIVTSPYKLLRASVVANVEWAKYQESKTFRPVKVAVYKMDVNKMQISEFLSTLIFLLGAPKKYLEKYQDLFEPTELAIIRRNLQGTTSLDGISLEQLIIREKHLQVLLEKYIDELVQNGSIYYSAQINGFTQCSPTYGGSNMCIYKDLPSICA